MLQTTTDRRVSIVNAEAIASELGVRVEARPDPSPTPFAGALRVTGGSMTVTGTSVNGSPRIVEAGGFEIDAPPMGDMLVTQHHDVPGMIGRVGTLLGDAKVNISTMQVSRNAIGGDAIMVLGIDRPADDETLNALRAIERRSLGALALALTVKLYIARHAETTWNLAGRYQGRRESALSARGIQQGFALAGRVRQRRPAAGAHHREPDGAHARDRQRSSPNA